MESQYDPRAIEGEIYARWEAAGYFEPRGEGAPYCIILPPPNVTGTLHMGHAFQATLMDALARRRRMRGERVLWQPGTDHAGIATQMVVERQLAAEGKSRRDMPREAFVERVWQWRRESGGHIERQFRRLGASLAWSRELFTLDEGPAAAVVETFVRLYDAGLIYRGMRLVNWDPVLQTALSDLEVVAEEEDGFLWHIRYPFADGEGALTVATTRPETMLGDVAVAVNPDDGRFAKFVGQSLRLPLTGRAIPVIADVHVDPEFGTGCVKVTPGHDFNDYEIGRRHGLPLLNVFTKDARIVADHAPDWHRSQRSANPPPRNEVSDVVDLATDIGIPERLRGLDRFEARERIVAELEREGLLEKAEPHKLKVPRGDRSGAVIEPYLTDQWFVDLTREERVDGRPGPGGLVAITRPALAAVRSGRIRFVPENWARTYFQWLENIQDWCISRQLWWGHRIPAWYDDDGKPYVGRSEREIRKRYHLAADVALHQDADVLDTWFSSGLWPLTTLGWPQHTADLAAFYPTSVLVTGFDIIFFWIARMVMMGLYLAGDVPFREVYVHGLIRDEHGQKMSKSKGNVLDPIDLIDGIGAEALVEKRTAGMMQPQLAERIATATRREFPEGIGAFGTDALRFTFAALASPGRDINFDLGRIGGYRNFCNKLWNATRFVLLNVEAPPAPGPDDVADRWIRSALAGVLAEANARFDEYRFDLAAQALYDFTWSAFCDWYLELAKPRLGAGGDDAGAVRHTLVTVLETLLRALHPLIPFITEALWQKVAPLAGRRGATIMLAPWPAGAEFERDAAAETEIEWVQAAVSALRQLRSELALDPGTRMPVTVHGAGAATRERLARHGAAIAFLARATEPPATSDAPVPRGAATAVVAEATLAVPLAGLIDAGAELARLDRTIARLEAERERIAGKLANEAFRTRAPEQVVERERARLSETEAALARYRTQRRRVAAIPRD